MQEKRQRALIITGIAAAVLLLTFGIILALRQVGKTGVRIVAVPEDSIITLDGKRISAGRVYVKNGTHTLKATREHFTEVTEKLDTNNLPEGNTIYLLPGADTPEAQKYLDAHPEVQMARERAGGARFAARSQAYAQKFPIVNDLPYKTLDFKVDYSPKGDDQISFTVTLYPVATLPGTPEYDQQLEEFKTEARNYLETQGIDPSKADITYTVAP